MDIDVTDLKKFVSEKVIRNASQREALQEFPLHLYQELHRLGYLQAFVKAENGGLELDTSELSVIAREISYGSGGLLIGLMANMMSHMAVETFGHTEQKKRTKDFVDRFSLSSFAWTEPDTGSDVFRIKTTAKKVGNHYLISGRKSFVTNGTFAESFLVVAQVEGEDQGLSVFLIPGRLAGMEVSSPLEKLGQFDTDTTTLFMDQVMVPSDAIVGKVGQASQIALHCLRRSRTLIAASSVGIAQRAIDLATHYLYERKLYGKPLIQQPQIRALLAELQTDNRASWLLTLESAKAWDAGDTSCSPSSMAKYFAANTAFKTCSQVLELFGGYGYMKEYEISRLFRDAKLLQIAEGPTFVQLAIIANELYPRHGVEALSVSPHTIDRGRPGRRDVAA